MVCCVCVKRAIVVGPVCISCPSMESVFYQKPPSHKSAGQVTKTISPGDVFL